MSRSRYASFLPLLAILGSVACLAIGTSFAKRLLFPLVGAQGTTAVRVGFAALLLLLFWRPWRWQITRRDAQAIVFYGLALGAMNLCFYMALRTIPFGIAVAIEFSGPLSIALLALRRLQDFLWVALAVGGLWLLLPLGHDVSTLDTTGVMFALAAALFWATYILFGKRVGHLHAGLSVPFGLAVATLLVVPVGIAHAGSALLSPWVLLVGLGVALISSAIPMMLEMVALKRLPPQAFGIMISMEPAVAALLALVLLDEYLSPAQWLAISMIMAASMGSAYSAHQQRRKLPLADHMATPLPAAPDK